MHDCLRYSTGNSVHPRHILLGLLCVIFGADADGLFRQEIQEMVGSGVRDPSRDLERDCETSLLTEITAIGSVFVPCVDLHRKCHTVIGISLDGDLTGACAESRVEETRSGCIEVDRTLCWWNSRLGGGKRQVHTLGVERGTTRFRLDAPSFAPDMHILRDFVDPGP